jgi:hypothetical protein
MVTVSSGLASKPDATVFSSLASKLVAIVSGDLASKPVVTVFSSLASKLVSMVSPGFSSKSAVGFLVEPQNQGGGGFLGLGLKTSSFFRDLGLKITATVSWFGPQNPAGHASRSSGLICVEATLARVSQSSLKTGGGAITGGARGTITEVAS